MNPSTTDLLGYVAACFTTLSFVPQVIKAWRSKDLRSISLGMYALFFLGIAMWLGYGLLLGAWPIIIANIITLGLSGLILCMKIAEVWGKKP